VRGQTRRRHRQRVEQVRGQDPGRAHPRREGAVLEGDGACLAIEGFSDHGGEKGGGGRGGGAGSDGDGGETQAEAVEEAAARVVVDQGFADELGGAVGGFGGGAPGFVDGGDEGGEGAAVDGLAGGVDDADGGPAGGADGFEEGAGGGEVDGEAEGEVGFGARRHDAVEEVGGVEMGRDD